MKANYKIKRCRTWHDFILYFLVYLKYEFKMFVDPFEKYKRMILFSGIMVSFLAISHCIKYNYEFTDYLYIVPFGALVGLVFGLFIAFFSWFGEKLSLWTLPDF